MSDGSTPDPHGLNDAVAEQVTGMLCGLPPGAAVRVAGTAPGAATRGIARRDASGRLVAGTAVSITLHLEVWPDDPDGGIPSPAFKPGEVVTAARLNELVFGPVTASRTATNPEPAPASEPDGETWRARPALL